MWRAFLVSTCLLSAVGCSTNDILGTQSKPASSGLGGSPAVGTGGASPVEPSKPLPNILEERNNIPLSQVNAQLNDAFLQLFFGNPTTESVFFDQGDGTGYIEDIANGDVRTDSMAYGMLATVELNQREVFDKLWAWAKTHMQSTTGASRGLLRWRCDTDGTNCASVAATDSSSIIATSLWIAGSRWGTAGAHDYNKDAAELLDAMTNIEARNGGVVNGVRNCFDTAFALPHVDSGDPSLQVPVDYLMPAFYEIWANHDLQNAAFYRKMAENSRSLLQQIPHPTTGLLPEAITFSGELVAGRSDYLVTTSRALLNLALDDLWFGPSAWIVDQNERRMDFFLDQGIDSYVAQYSLDGVPQLNYNTVAHRSLVAVTAGGSPNIKYNVFVDRLLEEEIPTGIFRYYDGMLYMLALLTLSGQMTPG